jgi:acetylornithine deacetylase/succinyl-diaminopimelate desuccinylase-like protein
LATDHPLVETLRRNIREVSGVEPRLGAVVPQSYASSDAAHLSAAGIPACLFGPTGGYDEGRADRWTSVSQIVTCARVLGGMIADVCA